MSVEIQRPWKGISFCLTLFLFVACGKSGGAGSGSSQACLSSQGLQVAFQQVVKRAAQPAGEKHLLVRLVKGSQDAESLRHDLQQEFSSLSGSGRISSVRADTLAVELPSSAESSPVLEKYIQEGRVALLEPDYKTFRLEASSGVGLSPGFPQENLPSNLRATATQGQTVIVAVIDSGVDFNHKDLAPYMWKNSKEIPANGIDDDGNGYIDDVVGWDFVNNDNEPIADDTSTYHGTHVAGIVKQAALLAEQGIQVRIMALKYLDSSAVGRTSDAIKAIDYAIQNGATVLNSSWGSSNFSSALSDAIERARQAQALFVAAAGNGDPSGVGLNVDSTPFYPAAYPHSNIISVAAVDAKGELAPWSNYGPASVDLAAPGVGISSTRNGNTYGVLSGTSMATPYVSGVAAMIWSLRADLSLTDIKKILFSSGVATPSLQGKVATNAMISRSQALQAVGSAVHDPNDAGSNETKAITACSP